MNDTHRKEETVMSEPIPTILKRDSPAVRAVRPLVEDARVLRGRVIEDLHAVDEELETLQRQGRQKLEEAKQQAEAVRDEARKQGRKEGLEECMEELAKARAEYGKLRGRAEQDMVTLAFQIARRIIGHAIEVHPEVVRDIIGEALVTARGRRQIEVRVHPDDQEMVEAERQRYARELDGVPVYFEADAALERGDCVIETESGRIDARLETQLEVLREALLSGVDPADSLASEERR